MKLKSPHIAWRNGRPRFVPGPRDRAIGFKGEDLRHKDGAWFTQAEAATWSAAKHQEIGEVRKRRAQTGQAPAAWRKQPPAEQPGFIYFIVSGKRVKIGYSQHPFGRARELRTGMPDGIGAMVAIPGTPHVERQLHAELAAYRQSGEWFDHNGVVMRRVQALLGEAARGKK